MLDIHSTVSLNDGHEIPLLGYGTWQVEGADCVRGVREALQAGYRHIDTARVYANEAEVGQGLRDSGIPREQVFVTSKINTGDFPRAKAQAALDDSLSKLGLEYLDLYLIHWPQDEHMMEAWEVLQKARDAGRIRSIGVSNFTVERFEKAFFPRTGEVPAVNQIELHPFWTRHALRDYCDGKGIVIEGYSPLARAEKLDDPTLRKIAARHGKSAAQVMIRWQIQQDIVVLPKSSHAERIGQNADVYDFTLDAEDMKTLDALDEGQGVLNWRPKGYY